ncbi:MAG: patatin-like phospholipase family protein [Bacteroidales bacterium]
MNREHKLGLTLSGGGVKGFAHAGALMAMEEFGLKPDVISGTSAGAIVGALYSSGHSPDNIRKIFKAKYFNSFVELTIPKRGLFGTSDFIRFLKDNILADTFEELKIPLYAVATDFDHGKSVVFSTGLLCERIMASACVPVFFNPIEIDGVHYVDGGIFRNFPVSVIRESCERVIGINVSPLISQKYSKTIVGVAERSYHLMFRANAEEDKKLCDILIEVEQAMQYRLYDIRKVDVIYKLGYDATKLALLNHIKTLTLAE